MKMNYLIIFLLCPQLSDHCQTTKRERRAQLGIYSPAKYAINIFGALWSLWRDLRQIILFTA